MFSAIEALAATGKTFKMFTTRYKLKPAIQMITHIIINFYCIVVKCYKTGITAYSYSHCCYPTSLTLHIDTAVVLLYFKILLAARIIIKMCDMTSDKRFLLCNVKASQGRYM